MFYDEKVYLNGDKRALNIIEEEKMKYIMAKTFNSAYFSDEISQYKKFLTIIRDVFKDLKINNPIELSIITASLIHSGYFSLTDEFQFEYRLEDELRGYLGFNILFGKGCCRNISAFFYDVLNSLGFEVDNFYCNSSHRSINFGRMKPANHLANIIYLNNRIYGFDPTNISLLNFINEKQMKAVNILGHNYYLRFKPYYGVITTDYEIGNIKQFYDKFQNESMEEPISLEEFRFFYDDAFSKLTEANRKTLMDFKEATMELKLSIKNGVNSKMKKLDKVN